MSARTEFELTAEKAEELAKSSMSQYKFRLLLYALLGYAVIFSVLMILFGLLGGLVGLAIYSTALLLLLVKKKLIFVILPVIWVLLKSLWVRIESPTGYSVTEKDCPELFAEIAKLRKLLKTPRIHKVILTPEFNASINQTPRLGIFGWNQNCLTLGMELLMTLSVQQAESVLAHEFGHLSGNHGRFNGWIYRARISWYRIMEAFHDADNVGVRIMRKFFDWYAPRFAAYSFALARMNEFEADMIAAELTSNDSASSALVNTYVSGPYIDQKYWQEYFSKADEMAAPDHAPWAGLEGFLGNHQPASDELSAKLAKELECRTSYDDTHPCLKDRLASLGTPASLPVPSKDTAAQVWLGAHFSQIVKDFDAEWMDANRLRWSERYEYVVASRKRLSTLAAFAEEQLSDDDLWSKATLTEEFAEATDAFLIFQKYHQRHPRDPNAAYVLGRMSFDNEDDDLLKYMELALEEPGLVIDACKYAYYFLNNANREKEAEWWRDRAEQQIAIDQESEQERETLEPKDTLLVYDSDQETIRYISDILKQHKKIKKAWLAQKKLLHYPDVPALAIAVAFKGFVYNREKITNEITEALELKCTFYVVAKGGEHNKLAKMVIKHGSRIV